MICKNCQQNIKDDTKFCPNCGMKVELGNETNGQINLEKSNTINNNDEINNVDNTMYNNDQMNNSGYDNTQMNDMNSPVYNDNSMNNAGYDNTQMNDMVSPVYNDNSMNNMDNMGYDNTQMNDMNSPVYNDNSMDNAGYDNTQMNDMSSPVYNDNSMNNMDNNTYNNTANNMNYNNPVNNTSNASNNNSKSPKNKKLIAIIGGVVVGAAIIIAALFFLLSGSKLSENDIKEKLAGQKLYIMHEDVKIPEGGVTELEIISRKADGDTIEDITCKATIELDGCKVVAQMDVTAFYNSRKKEWDDISISDVKVDSFEPNETIETKLPELLKKSTIKYKDSYIKFEDREISEISDVTVTDNDGVKDVTATLTITNGIVNAKVSINCEAEYNVASTEWKLSSDYLTGKVVEEPSLVADITDENKVEFIKNSFGDGSRTTFYGDSSTGSMSVHLAEDKVTDLTVSSFELKDNKVTATIKGKFSNGIIKEMDFSGNVILNASLEDTYESNKYELKIDDVKFDLLPEDVLKKTLLKYRLDDKTPVSQAIADTGKVVGENNESKKSSIKFDCTMVVDGVTKNLVVHAYPDYDRDTKSYTYNISLIKILV